MTPIINHHTFTAPLSPAARQLAKHWSGLQPLPEKASQILLNTLAVSFVDFYCQCMGIETEIDSSQSRNPVWQNLLDVADLQLKNLGKLECRPVLSGAESVYVPLEVHTDRIGYVVVEISANYREARILGFLKQVQDELICLSKIQPLENFLSYIEAWQNQTVLDNQDSNQATDLINLKHWLENIFEETWQPINSLMEPQLAMRSLKFRNNAVVGRAKQINLAIDFQEKPIILVVTLHPENYPNVNICVEAHPSKNASFLPPNLQLMILDADGTAVMEAQAKQENSNIQFKFSGEAGEEFGVKIALENSSFVEKFVI